MTVKISKEKIFWDDNSDNKPSQSYFNTFKSNMTSSSIHINQEAFERITVVIPNVDISYIWLNDSKYDYYYYYNRIVKVLPEGFMCEFVIDIFTTFTLPYWESLKSNSTQLKFNRHKDFAYEGIMYDDDMLSSIPILLNRRVRKLTDIVTGIDTGSSGLNIKFSLPSADWGASAYYQTKKTRKTHGGHTYTSKFYKPILYVVYSEINGIATSTSGLTKFALFPILDGEPVYFKTDSLKPQWFDNATKQSDGTVKLNNTYDFLTDTMYNALNKSNQFKGIYMGPSIGNFNAHQCNLFESSGNYALYVEMTAEGLKINDKIGTLPSSIFLTKPTSLNRSDKLSIYAAKYIDFMYYNHKIDIRTLVSSSDYNSSSTSVDLHLSSERVNMMVNYTSCIFTVANQKLFPLNSNTYSFPADLPIYIDNYVKYIQATKNTRDTGIDIAKQNMIMDQTSNALGFVSNIVSSGAKALTGDLTGAVVGGFFGQANTIMDMTRTGVGFEQKKQMMQAELADKRTSLTSTVQSGTVSDAAIASYISRIEDYFTQHGSNDWGDYVEYSELTPSTIRSLNNVLYLYGQFRPVIATISAVTYSGVDFNYYKLDAEYLTNVFATTLRTAKNLPLQREFYIGVYNSLVNGIRLWDKKPTW